MAANWPSEVSESLDRAFTSAIADLAARGISSRHYVIPDCDAYVPVTGAAADVWCLEAEYGPAARRPGDSLIGLFQAFDPAFPNLGLSYLGHRRSSDGTVVSDHRLPLWDLRQDRLHNLTFMPVVLGLLGPLDPTGQRHSQLVAPYHGRSTPAVVATAPRTTRSMLADARRQGQLAAIWPDFKAPFSAAITRLARRLNRGIVLELVPRTALASRVRVPVLSPGGEISYFQDFSTALDQGMSLARDYLAADKDT